MKNSTFLLIASVCMIIFLFLLNKALNLFEIHIQAYGSISNTHKDDYNEVMNLERPKIGFEFNTQNNTSKI